MASGGPTPNYNIRYATEQRTLIHLNAFPVQLGVIECSSITVPASNATTAPTATYTTAIPFSTLVAGMCVHLQADAPGFVGDGPTSAIAIAAALAKTKRLDAWEPYTPALNEDNPTGATLTRTSDGQVLWFLAYVLQSAGAGALFVGRQK